MSWNCEGVADPSDTTFSRFNFVNVFLASQATVSPGVVCPMFQLPLASAVTLNGADGLPPRGVVVQTSVAFRSQPLCRVSFTTTGLVFHLPFGFHWKVATPEPSVWTERVLATFFVMAVGAVLGLTQLPAASGMVTVVSNVHLLVASALTKPSVSGVSIFLVILTVEPQRSAAICSRSAFSVA